MIRQLTEGDWEVFAIDGVDEDGGWVYFSANRDNPIGRDFYRVKLDGSSLERLTEGKGSHRIDLNPSASAFLDSFSAMTDTGRTTFHDLATDRSLPFHEQLAVDQLDLVEPEWKLLDTSDGAKVGLLLLKPSELENKKYPVLVYVYGMLGAPTIRDAWGGNRYLFHQFLAQKGYVVAVVDDRTSAIWGHKYAVLGDHNVGPLSAKDHEVAVNYLKALPFVDGERMAVWGWSGGGFSTAYHMTHTKLFKVGIVGIAGSRGDPEAYERTSSVKAAANYSGRMLIIHGTQDDNVHPQNTIQLVNALIENRKQFDLMLYPGKTHAVRGKDHSLVTDWHLYDTIYTERYMGTPRGDPEAYERTSSVKAAANYSGRMLIIHGTQDDNVHPQNTIQLVNALIENRKQFDLMLYPGKTHAVRGKDQNIHLWTMVYEYLERYLK